MCCRDDKLLHVMVLLKLGLVQRKVLLFINSINEGYRLRLFLEAFGIKSAVLNSELPLNSRHHILQVYRLNSAVGPQWNEGSSRCVRGGVGVSCTGCLTYRCCMLPQSHFNAATCFEHAQCPRCSLCYPTLTLLLPAVLCSVPYCTVMCFDVMLHAVACAPALECLLRQEGPVSQSHKHV